MEPHPIHLWLDFESCVSPGGEVVRLGRIKINAVNVPADRIYITLYGSSSGDLRVYLIGTGLPEIEIDNEEAEAGQIVASFGLYLDAVRAGAYQKVRATWGVEGAGNSDNCNPSPFPGGRVPCAEFQLPAATGTSTSSCGACSPAKVWEGGGINYYFDDGPSGIQPVSTALRNAFDAAASRWNTHLSTTTKPWRFNQGFGFKISIDPLIDSETELALWGPNGIRFTPLINATLNDNLRAKAAFHELGHQAGWFDVNNCGGHTATVMNPAVKNATDHPTDFTSIDLCKFNKDFNVVP
jgi:hypothetical protein